MKKALGINSNTLGALSTSDRMNKLQLSLHDCVYQLNAINEIGNDAKVQSGNDFMKMVHVEQMVVRLQAKFRQRLTMRKLDKDIQIQKERLKRKQGAAQGKSNEELALQELKTRLAKKGLTPEAFFRTCDTSYLKTISVDNFKSNLSNFNLQLTRGQVSRLALILDEDMEGNITLQEYYNALEAYNCSGENHVDPDGSDYYCSFEHRAMFKLLKILRERGISYQELYRSCDVNDDKDVNVKEL